MSPRRTRPPRDPYGPLRLRTLLPQLLLWLVVEYGLWLVYDEHASRFHWATHFLVGTSAGLLWLLAVLQVRRRPARGQLLVLLLLHVVAATPDLIFQAGRPHELWMDVFLGHVVVHRMPGGDDAWLVIATSLAAVYTIALSSHLRRARAEQPST